MHAITFQIDLQALVDQAPKGHKLQGVGQLDPDTHVLTVDIDLAPAQLQTADRDWNAAS